MFKHLILIIIIISFNLLLMCLYIFEYGILIPLVFIFKLSKFFQCQVVFFTMFCLYWNRNIYKNPIDFPQILLIVNISLIEVIIIHLYKYLILDVYLSAFHPISLIQNVLHLLYISIRSLFYRHVIIMGSPITCIFFLWIIWICH